jgi:hypothetical protein
VFPFGEDLLRHGLEGGQILLDDAPYEVPVDPVSPDGAAENPATARSLLRRARTSRSARWPPGCPRDVRDRPSQGNRLRQDLVADLAAQKRLGKDVHPCPEQFLEVHQQPAEIGQAAACFEIDEKIYVTFRILSPRATDPNTRTFDAPCSAATLRIKARLVLRSSFRVMQLYSLSKRGSAGGRMLDP